MKLTKVYIIYHLNILFLLKKDILENLSYRFQAKISSEEDDILLAQQLRSLVFRKNTSVVDTDIFDDKCQHILVVDKEKKKVVCVFRIMKLENGDEIEKSYSSQFYDLSELRKIANPLLEMGRFCIHPEYKTPDILVIAWATLINFVKKNKVSFIFGCSSFHGLEIKDHQDAFMFLRKNHLAPRKYKPYIKSPQIFNFSKHFKYKRQKNINLGIVNKTLPPLLRYYLSLGGWVSDHAVMDFDLKTLHVFTGLNIKSIPSKRMKFLQRIAMSI